MAQQYDSEAVEGATWLFQQDSGLPNARNLGLSAASGEIALFLDDDVILETDYVEHLMRFLSENRDVGGVGGIYQSEEYDIYLHDLRWRLEKAFLGTWVGENAPIGRIHPTGFTSANFEFLKSPMDVQLLNGCNMAFRRSVVQVVGAFDQNYTGNGLYEDADFSYRAWKRGIRLVATPTMRLFHKGKPHAEYPHYPKYVYDFAANGTYFYFKNVYPERSGSMLLFIVSRLYFGAMMLALALLRRDIKYSISYWKGIRDGLSRARHYLLSGNIGKT